MNKLFSSTTHKTASVSASITPLSRPHARRANEKAVTEAALTTGEANFNPKTGNNVIKKPKEGNYDYLLCFIQILDFRGKNGVFRFFQIEKFFKLKSAFWGPKTGTKSKIKSLLLEKMKIFRKESVFSSNKIEGKCRPICDFSEPK